ncbi:hypothetical protein BH10ACT11_BH10ACT11_15050 [soil metagenome]
MADSADALKLVTDPSNVSPLPVIGPQETYAVNSKRVMRALRDQGAGKAEARELALNALEEAGGGAEIRSPRGSRVAGGRGGATGEDWWVPKSAVRFS